MKSVQISYDLFVALVEYHLAYDDDYAEEIHQGLEQKLDAMVRHTMLLFQVHLFTTLEFQSPHHVAQLM